MAEIELHNAFMISTQPFYRTQSKHITHCACQLKPVYGQHQVLDDPAMYCKYNSFTSHELVVKISIPNASYLKYAPTRYIFRPDCFYHPLIQETLSKSMWRVLTESAMQKLKELQEKIDSPTTRTGRPGMDLTMEQRIQRRRLTSRWHTRLFNAKYAQEMMMKNYTSETLGEFMQRLAILSQTITEFKEAEVGPVPTPWEPTLNTLAESASLQDNQVYNISQIVAMGGLSE